MENYVKLSDEANNHEQDLIISTFFSLINRPTNSKIFMTIPKTFEVNN